MGRSILPVSCFQVKRDSKDPLVELELFAEVLPLAVRAKPIDKTRCNRLNHRPEAI